MKKCLLVLCLAASGAAFAAPPPPPVNPDDYAWRDGVKDLSLEGRGFPQEAAPYARLPERLRKSVTPKVWNLSRTTIGFNARFATDSTNVVVQWRVRPQFAVTGNFTPAMLAGVDVYARQAGQAWRHVSVGAPDGKTGVGELSVRWTPGEECLVYLPVRVGVESLRIGVVRGASFAAPAPHKFAKPIVHYGTSIVNGGCASRPGLIFPAIMGRLLDAEVVDLGFSGAGKMELPMADLVAEIDAAAYVIDCEWNMYVKLQQERYEPFVRRLKELRPDTPVLLCGACTERSEPRETETYARGVYERLRTEDPAKWANWHYLSGVEMLPNDTDCTFDHCHPNDWGFAQMGRVYADALARILSAPSSADPTVQLTRGDARCTVDLRGGRILSYVAGGEEILWNEGEAFDPSALWIHGGIPLAWPWFGRFGKGDESIHGYAWKRTFGVRERTPSRLVLSFETDAAVLDYTVELAEDGLSLRAQTTNKSQFPFPFSVAFHPYFRVGERDRVTVEGIGAEPIPVTNAVDGVRKFAAPEASRTYRIRDRALNRTLCIESENSTGVNLWNPGFEKDCPGVVPGDGWRRFVAVEPFAMGLNRFYVLAPGESHVLTMKVRKPIRP